MLLVTRYGTIMIIPTGSSAARTDLTARQAPVSRLTVHLPACRKLNSICIQSVGTDQDPAQSRKLARLPMDLHGRLV